MQDETENSDDKSNDLEVLEVIKVVDIPIPEDDLITIDDADDVSIFLYTYRINSIKLYLNIYFPKGHRFF